MSFNKRDYFYEDATESSELGLSEIPDGEKERAVLQVPVRDKVPNDWIYDLMNELQETSKTKGVALLDTCTLTNLARFTGRYNQDVWGY
jgi:hypothetical protein